MRLRPFLVVTSAVALVACSDSGSADPATTAGSTAATSSVADPTSTTAATTLDGRLAQAYPDPVADPSPAAWQALLADPTLAGVAVTVLEFAGVRDDAGRAAYSSFVDAIAAAAEARHGHLIGVSDIRRNGLEVPTGYEGGMVWVATFPSRDAYIDAVLDPSVASAAAGRRDAVVDPYQFVGVNLVPETLLQLPSPGPADDLPHDLVRGREVSSLVDELLSIYSDGGPDPTRASLEEMLSRPDMQTQAVSYVNLYAFSAGDTGAAGITEYNTGALPFVLAHGARPKAVFNVAQQLLGSTEWNRVIYVRWPSIEVFTDLRLTPGYIEAQKARVSSSDAYGNLITVDRADAG